MINKINHLHKGSLLIVCKDKRSTIDDLFNRDGSVSIHYNNTQKLGTEMFKFVKDLRPEIGNDIFQFREEFYYPLRSTASLNVPLFQQSLMAQRLLDFLDQKSGNLF